MILLMRTICMVIILVLTGCKHLDSSDKMTSLYDRYKNKNNRYTQKYDGAPAINKNISLKQPIPKNEPLSRYGNPAEYNVLGEHYEVLTSVKGFKQRGVASWYGTKFHKQRTSSGEPYDMYRMSAAHKTLPLPTYVKVTNLNTGAHAVVKVNDRGPFHADRIIDLSYAAALKLGVMAKGTAPVEVEVLKGPVGSAKYSLQAGAFLTEKSAIYLKEKLLSVTASPINILHFDDHYVVRIGPFDNKEIAINIKGLLSKKGISTFSVLS